MNKEPEHVESSTSAEIGCSKCGRAGLPLQRCCLTGDREHARYFFLCNDCIGDIVSKSPLKQTSQTPAASAMTERDKKFETRRQKAFDRLGTDEPICPFCGETDWRCMELHHIAGDGFDQTLVTVCRNCHRKLSDMQKDHPPKLAEEPTRLESIAHFLLGLADLFLLLEAKLLEFGNYLLDYARNS